MLSPLLGGSLTLTASGGPVTWSITESSGLVGRLTVSPSSGLLLAGRSTTVTLSAICAATGLSALAVVGTAWGVRGLPAHREPGQYQGHFRDRHQHRPELSPVQLGET